MSKTAQAPQELLLKRIRAEGGTALFGKAQDQLQRQYLDHLPMPWVDRMAARYGIIPESGEQIRMLVDAWIAQRLSDAELKEVVLPHVRAHHPDTLAKLSDADLLAFVRASGNDLVLYAAGRDRARRFAETPRYTAVDSSNTAEAMGKILADHYGREAIGGLIAAKKLVLLDTPLDLPASIRAQFSPERLGDIAGATLPDGAVYLVASQLRPEQVAGVFLHEVGEHAALADMLGEDYGRVCAQFDRLLTEGDTYATWAAMRVPRSTPAQHIPSERLAYLVERVANDEAPREGGEGGHALGSDCLQQLRTWVFRSPTCRWLDQIGMLETFNLSPNDMASLAREAVNYHVQRETGLQTGPANDWDDRLDAAKLDDLMLVDPVARTQQLNALPATEALAYLYSLAALDAPAMIETINLWRATLHDLAVGDARDLATLAGAILEEGRRLEVRHALRQQVDDHNFAIWMDRADDPEHSSLYFASRSAKFEGSWQLTHYRADLGVVGDTTYNTLDDALACAQATSFPVSDREAPSLLQQYAQIRFHAVWHGSPHRFEQFSTDAIGTGEGAQAFGWGLYFAGDQEVGAWYREQLGRYIDSIEIDGVSRPLEEVVSEHLGAGMARAITKARPNMSIDQFNAFVTDDLVPELRGALALQQEEWGRVRAASGHLYAVELTPSLNDYLDWDSTLGEQSPEVRERLQAALADLDSVSAEYHVTGKALYKALVGALGGERQASEHLHAHGIPGIRYLNGLSRYAEGGDIASASNFVIFDSRNTRISAKLRTTDMSPALRVGAELLVENDPELSTEERYLLSFILNEYRVGRKWSEQGFEAELQNITEFMQDQGATPAAIQANIAALRAVAADWLARGISANPVVMPTPDHVLARQAFDAWHRGSVVVDDAGQPLVVYRGEHGHGDGNWLNTRHASFSFGDLESATTYALEPNNYRLDGAAGAQPRITPVYLTIKKPLIDNRTGDPFIDMPVLIEALGQDKAGQIAVVLADYIYNTESWHSGPGERFDSIEDMLEQAPQALAELYVEAYPILDNPTFVEWLKEAGFDGAIYGGSGATHGKTEYRVFSESQVQSAIGKRASVSASPASVAEQLIENAALENFLGKTCARNANGSPKILYHATNGDFTQFDVERSSGVAGSGIYMTDKRPSGDSYGTFVMPLYASIQNPADFSSGDAAISDMAESFGMPRLSDLDSLPAIRRWSAELRLNLMAAGYDGALVKGENGNTYYVAYSANQVKSALGNNGNFDRANPDIRFSMGRQQLGPQQVDTRPDEDGFEALLGADGQPLVVYHGTTATITVPGEYRPGDAAALATLKELAAKYNFADASSVANIFERWERMGQLERFGVTPEMVREARRLNELSKGEHTPSVEKLAFDTFRMPEGDTELGVHLGNKAAAEMFGTAFPMHISMRQPLRLPDLGTWKPSDVIKSMRQVGIAISDAERQQVLDAPDQNAAMRALIQAKGFDGVIYRNEAEGYGDSYIVLDPAQIKPAAEPALSQTEGVRYAFAGENALTADLQSLQAAKARIVAGEDADLVRQQTGWYAGVDGMWRFEIDDSKAKLNIMAFRSEGQTHVARLGDVLDHPTLYAAYPSLRNMVVKTTFDYLGSSLDGDEIHLSNQFRSLIENTLTAEVYARQQLDTLQSRIGAADAGQRQQLEGQIRELSAKLESGAFSSENPDALLSSLTHEIQHAIQDRENFAAGGNPFMEQLPTNRTMAQAINRRYAEKAAEIKASPRYQQLLQEALEALPAERRINRRTGLIDNDVALRRAEQDIYKSSGLLALEEERSARVNAFLDELERQSLDNRYAAYRRLAGEVEARNVQARRTMTEDERLAAAPGATADYPADEQIIIDQPLPVIWRDEPMPSRAVSAKLASEGLGQTETPEFKAWLADSKVVDKKGRPLVMYHRTAADFDVFDTDRGDLGAHFGTAEQAENLLDGRMRDGERTIPVYLSIKNPIRLTDLGNFHADAVAPQLKRKGIIDAATAKRLYEAGDRGTAAVRREANREIKRILEAAGYDGVVYKNTKEGKGDSYIAFQSEQIKSAIGNNGNFDRANPDIRYNVESFGDAAVVRFNQARDRAAALLRSAGYENRFEQLSPRAVIEEWEFAASHVRFGADVPEHERQLWNELDAAYDDLFRRNPGAVDVFPEFVAAPAAATAPEPKSAEIVKLPVPSQQKPAETLRNPPVEVRTPGNGEWFWVDRFGEWGTYPYDSREEAVAALELALNGGELPKARSAAEPAKVPQTETPEFKAWFRNSQVVDESGRPLRLYHGTATDFVSFDPNAAVVNDAGYMGAGSYFITQTHDASQYAFMAADAANPEESTEDLAVGARVLPVYLSIQNPYRLADGDRGTEGMDRDEVLAWTERLKEQGYDGVVNAAGNEWVAFDPTQIKSAIGNNGDFDPTNPDIRYSFVGERAQGVSLEALGDARRLLAAGANAEAVRKATGWFKGVDGHWRFEIDDSNAKPLLEGQGADFWESVHKPRGGLALLGELLDHPALFAAYPELSDIPVRATVKPGAPLSGGWDGTFMSAHGASEADVIQVLHHEAQHWVQEREGFAKGGATSKEGVEVARKLGKEVGATDEELNALRLEQESLRQQASAKSRLPRYKGQAAEVRDLLAKANDLGTKIEELTPRVSLADAFDGYQRLAGEVESRNVEARLRLSAEERRETPPEATADRTPEEQVVIGAAPVQPAEEGMRFVEEVHGSAYGQLDVTLGLRVDGTLVGTLDYSVYQGTPHIKMITVSPEFRRNGYGRELVMELQRQHPNTAIDFGMLTDEGSLLYKSLPKIQVETEFKAGIEELARLRAERDMLIEAVDRYNATETPDAELQATRDRAFEVLNDLHDRIYDLECEVDGEPAYAILIDTAQAASRPQLAANDGTRFSFVGASASIPAVQRLDEAKVRNARWIASGESDLAHSPEQVRKETGWFVGADGLWRVELDDSKARLKPAIKSLQTGGYGATRIKHLDYAQRADGTFDLTLVPPRPQHLREIVSLQGLSPRIVRSLLPEEVYAALRNEQGEESLIGSFDPAKRLSTEFEFPGIYMLPLGDVLDHPELFAAYPSLRTDVMVMVDPKLGNNAEFLVLGSGQQVVRLGTGKQLSSLSHELQHVVQRLEGFSQGGSVEKIRDQVLPELRSEVERLEASLTRSINQRSDLVGMVRSRLTAEDKATLLGNPVLRDSLNELYEGQADDDFWEAAATNLPEYAAAEDLTGIERSLYLELKVLNNHISGLFKRSAELKERIRQIEFDGSTGTYQKLAGEVEARNVQARLGLSATERLELAPELSADVAPADQLVLWRGQSLPSTAVVRSLVTGTLNAAAENDGTRFSFVGERAEGSFHARLEEAKTQLATLQQAGRTDAAELVRQETGWFVGVDGKWRMEIDDSSASLRDAWYNAREQVNGKPLRRLEGTLGDRAFQFSPEAAERLGIAERTIGGVLNHPALLAAYPALAEVQVDIYESEGFAVAADGYYSHDDNKIRLEINPALGGDPLSALMHEVTHVVQILEGFARGGSPALFHLRDGVGMSGERYLELRIEQLERKLLPVIQAFAEDMTAGKISAVDLARLATQAADEIGLNDLRRRLREARDPFDAYQRLAGEVEARNVQVRLGMTAAERRASAPGSTADVPERQQIVWGNLELGGEQRLTPREPVRQTDLPAFKRWFGNSLVVDEDGKPQVMYHGSHRDLLVFDRMWSTRVRQVSMDTVGSWFSDNPGQGGAGMYAGGEGGVIYPVYLSIARPKVYDTFSDFLRDMHEANGNRLEDMNPPGIGSPEALRERLKAQGYDGIAFTRTDNQQLHAEAEELRAAIARAWDEFRAASREMRENGMEMSRADGAPYQAKIDRLTESLARVQAELRMTGGSTEFDQQYVWIAFEPNQIKSAIGNNGNFEPTNPDIRFRLVDEQPNDVLADAMAAEQVERENVELRPLDMSKAARLRRAREMGFDTTVVWYHGSENAGFASFDTDGNGKKSTEGTGAFFSDNRRVARGYSGSADDAPLHTGVALFNDPDLVGDLEIEKVWAIVDAQGNWVPSRWDLQTAFPVDSNDSPEQVLEDNEIELDPGESVQLRYTVYLNGHEEITAGTKEECIEYLDNAKFSEPGIYEVYLRTKNVLEIDWEGNNWDNGPAEPIWRIEDENGDTVDWLYSQEEADEFIEANPEYVAVEDTQQAYMSTNDAARQAREMGYDAVVIKNVYDNGPHSYGDESSTVMAVFDPSNIRSVNAAFDPEQSASSDIRLRLADSAAERQQLGETETPAFKRWFGRSILVDGNGKPLVLYHGTRASFSTFDPLRQGTVNDAGWYGAGFYFTPNPQVASRYAADEGGNVMPVHVSMERPYYWRDHHERGLFQNYGPASLEKTAELKAAGHDGVIVTQDFYSFANGMSDESWALLTEASPVLANIGRERLPQLLSTKEYPYQMLREMYGKAFVDSLTPARTEIVEVVAFEPHQIKSAIGNNGNFDRANPDIRYSKIERALADRFDPADAGALILGQSELPKLHSVFHGSPHTFDQFKLERIGSGEGAQAFGWGLYFADLRGVASYYKGKGTKVAKAHNLFEGKRLTRGRIDELCNSMSVPYECRSFFRDNQKALQRGENVLDLLRAAVAKSEMQVERDKRQAARAERGESTPFPAVVYQMSAVAHQEHLQWLLSNFGKFEHVPEVRKGGNLYQVELAANPESYLHWDMPLAEQPESVRAAFAMLGVEGEYVLSVSGEAGKVEHVFYSRAAAEQALLGHQKAGMTAELSEDAGRRFRGKEMYKALSAMRGGDKLASEALREAGVPGLRFFDAPSRRDQSGSCNYVLFDDALALPVARNGVPVMVPQEAASARASSITDIPGVALHGDFGSIQERLARTVSGMVTRAEAHAQELTDRLQWLKTHKALAPRKLLTQTQSALAEAKVRLKSLQKWKAPTDNTVLAWDAPITQRQRARLSKLGEDFAGMTGGQVLQVLTSTKGSALAATAALTSAGVTGIRDGQRLVLWDATTQQLASELSKVHDLAQFHLAYHGSRHTFDEFRSEQIGSGEGAQAYGYGLYFTSGKLIARDYQTAHLRSMVWYEGELFSSMRALRETVVPRILAANPELAKVNYGELEWHLNKMLTAVGHDHSYTQSMLENTPEEFRDLARHLAEGVRKTEAEQIKSVFIMPAGGVRTLNDIENNPAYGYALQTIRGNLHWRIKPQMSPAEMHKALRDTVDLVGDVAAWRESLAEVMEGLERHPNDTYLLSRMRDCNWYIREAEEVRALLQDYPLEQWQVCQPIGQGMLYMVELDIRDSEYLDHQASYDQQSPKVQDALTRLARAPEVPEDMRQRLVDGILKNARGFELYGALALRDPENIHMAAPMEQEKVASALLLTEGVQGIRYPDGMLTGRSQSKTNYVVFDESRISIIGQTDKVITSETEEIPVFDHCDIGALEEAQRQKRQPSLNC